MKNIYFQTTYFMIDNVQIPDTAAVGAARPKSYFALEDEAKCARGCSCCTITPLSRNGNGNGNGNGIVSAELEASENFVVCTALQGRKIQNHLICGIARSSKVPNCGGGAVCIG